MDVAPCPGAVAYADLCNDCVFRKVFGHHEDVLRARLNDLLERSDERAITAQEYLPPEPLPSASGLTLSVLDVRCRTAAGETFVVEMQTLPLTGFLNRGVYNARPAWADWSRGGRTAAWWTWWRCRSVRSSRGVTRTRTPRAFYTFTARFRRGR